jgi:hypothetical protein
MEFPDLKNFNPQSIKGFDPASLKKITPEDVRDFLLERKFESAAVFFLLAGVLAGYYIYSNNSLEISTLDQQVQALKQKEDPVKAYQKTLSEKAKILRSVPPALNEDSVIPAIADIARKNQVRITSFSPPVLIKESNSRRISSDIICVASSFNEALLFLYSIENSKFSLRVDSWTGKPLDASQQSYSRAIADDLKTDEQKSFMMSISVSSIEVLANDQSLKD